MALQGPIERKSLDNIIEQLIASRHTTANILNVHCGKIPPDLRVKLRNIVKTIDGTLKELYETKRNL